MNKARRKQLKEVKEMKPQLRYRIYGIIDLDADDAGEIQDKLESIREIGTAEIVGVEVLSEPSELPEVTADFIARKGRVN